MSQKNVEGARRGFDLWNRAVGTGDEAGRQAAMQQMLADYHPDVALDYSRTLPDFAPTRGRQAMASWTEGAREVFGSVLIEPLQYVDAGEAIVVRVRMVAQGASSGANAGGEFVYVFRYEAQQIVSATSCPAHARCERD